MIEDIRQKVKAHLKPSRYKHTLGVCKLAVSLAKHYNISQEDAEIAGLLHDYHKYASDEMILSKLKEYNIELDPVLRHRVNLAHGLVSAIFARETYHVNQDIYNAIANHTFGRPGMSMLEKIIYLADSLEEGRSFEGIEDIRSLLYTDIDRCLLLACQNTLIFELKKSNMVHVQTIQMRNEILEVKQWTQY